MAYLGVLLLVVVAVVRGREATIQGREATGQGREATVQGKEATNQGSETTVQGREDRRQGREATVQGREATGQQCRAGPGYHADTTSGCDRYYLHPNTLWKMCLIFFLS